VTPLSDAAIARLRLMDDQPVFPGGRYEVRGEVGRGGMGVVYRVFDNSLGRDVAMKVVAPGAMGNDAAARLRREAQALARLEHPGIVPVHDVGQLADERVYYAMKLVRGDRLDERMARGISLGEGVRLVIRVCDAVAFAHAQGVIHRDLKPQNVMIAPFGEVLVMDWGVAKMRADVGFTGNPEPLEPPADDKSPGGVRPTTQDGVVLGTPGYMAPEQAAGTTSAIDERTDVFALGVILREVATAALAGARTPAPLASIISKASAPESLHRYSGADALGRDLSAFLDRLPLEAHRETLPERLTRLVKRHRVAIALVLAYVLVRAVILIALSGE